MYSLYSVHTSLCSIYSLSFILFFNCDVSRLRIFIRFSCFIHSFVLYFRGQNEKYFRWQIDCVVLPLMLLLPLPLLLSTKAKRVANETLRSMINWTPPTKPTEAATAAAHMRARERTSRNSVAYSLLRIATNRPTNHARQHTRSVCVSMWYQLYSKQNAWNVIESSQSVCRSTKSKCVTLLFRLSFFHSRR